MAPTKQSTRRQMFLSMAWAFIAPQGFAEAPIKPPTESGQDAEQRRRRVVQRRQQVTVICHRGASEFAHENTLEAYRAALELGADGNEIDIRATKDGVFVCFHDDILDRLLDAYGEVSEFIWNELRVIPFRRPGPFGEHCRIPTLIEVFDLHRHFAGLLHLDIKQAGLDRSISELIDRMDMWDHITYCNAQNADAILRHPRLKLLRYKAPGLYEDRSEVFPDAIAAALKNTGDGLIVDDPRGVLVAFGRRLGRLSRKPVSPVLTAWRRPAPPPEPELIRVLRDDDDCNRVAKTDEEKRQSARRILHRARAADQLLARGSASPEAFSILAERVRRRSLHPDWRYHGADGAAALRSLILLKAPPAIDLARFALWRDDPALEAVTDPRWTNPRAWTDFRIKMVVFPALETCPGSATAALCREYLALGDDDARRLGPPLFAEAAKTLLTVSPGAESALELLNHRLRAVRGRAILDCLSHAGQPWALAALTSEARHALAYRVPD